MKPFAGIFFACLCFAPVCLFAQSKPEADTAYTRVITERAAKIVGVLGVADVKKSTVVRDLIADQYRQLNEVYAARDERRKSLKAQFAADKATLDAKVKDDDAAVTAATDKLHEKFIANLSKNLTPAQVDQVKDGMTYSVLQVTWKAYNNMILTLTDDQKKQILAWLVEAREHAMDAESSEKKHAWFGKYKGRINNYLSAAGYDMKKEEAAWMERMKSAPKSN